MYPIIYLFFFACSIGYSNSKRVDPFPLLIGSAMYDITGPAAEIGMMGYGQFNQPTAGIHQRQRARAYVVVDKLSGERVAYVNLDICMMTLFMKKLVVEGLNKVLPGVYSHDNVLLCATHTHSGPGGFSWYTFYDITTIGWKKETVDVIVNGIVNAIAIAHNNVKSGRILWANGTLATPQTNINRSPTAYIMNPEKERKQYQYDAPKENFLIRFQTENKTELGVINWYSVHGTSMNNTNRLISGDNKGYGMYLFEKYKNKDMPPGFGTFVAGFTNTNEGDVSPNTKGAFCLDGTPCDAHHSTCNGRNQECRGYGPGKEHFESTKIIGRQQFESALKLFESAKDSILGGVASRHIWVDFENIHVDPKFTGLNMTIKTCPAAIGDSFAAGTTDGCGEFNFEQGNNETGNPFWNFLAGFLTGSEPTKEQKACHYPKPILLNTGFIKTPTPWSPSVLPLQLFKIGKLYIIGVPSEFSTMAGRRLMNTVKTVLIENGAPRDIHVVLSGLANGYSQYTVTREEYQAQRYEGASTLYGPWQLAAYQQLYTKLAISIIKNTPLEPGTPPVDYTSSLLDFQPGVLFDDGPIGTVMIQPRESYKKGDIVKVVFQTAHPRNNFRTQKTFLTVDQKQPDGNFKPIAWDGDWETKYVWERIYSWKLGESKATITWEIPFDTVPGTYRITHYGDKKSISGKITEFTVTSKTFEVL